MQFKNREEAGKLLAKKLEKYKGKNIIVYALPRGGVVPALEIARFLKSPLDLIITRKIGHPYQPEYAIGAISESGRIVGSKEDMELVDKDWLKKEIKKQQEEIVRRRNMYLKGRESIDPKGKIAIIVDDGIATGLTIQAAILALKQQKPKEIIIAVPVVPKETAAVLKKDVDEIIALTMPSEDEFLGAVGAYYQDFSQVEDKDVISLLKSSY